VQTTAEPTGNYDLWQVLKKDKAVGRVNVLVYEANYSTFSDFAGFGS